MPAVKIVPNITGLRVDEQLEEFLVKNKDKTAMVNFGSSWCAHCHLMFPHFLALAAAFPSLAYAVAQVDSMQQVASTVTHTPTFVVYRRGRKVDSFFGANAQQLRDHLWLHSD